jgi:hypothetical protein
MRHALRPTDLDAEACCSAILRWRPLNRTNSRVCLFESRSGLAGVGVLDKYATALPGRYVEWKAAYAL